MEIRILERRENPLVGREEIRFQILHPGEATPSRQAVKDQLASLLGGGGDLLVILRLRTHQGSCNTLGLAHLYRSPDRLKKFAPKHLLQRGVKGEKAEGEKGGEG